MPYQHYYCSKCFKNYTSFGVGVYLHHHKRAIPSHSMQLSNRAMRKVNKSDAEGRRRGASQTKRAKLFSTDMKNDSF